MKEITDATNEIAAFDFDPCKDCKHNSKSWHQEPCKSCKSTIKISNYEAQT